MAASVGSAAETAAEELFERVLTGGVLPERAEVVAMLSGGRDSVCLLDMAARACGAGAVRALHVNYGLRTEADDEQARCEALCERVGVRLRVVRAERGAGKGGNLQAWARDARYEAARELAAHGGAPIATGHTASDQAETVLYRLAASPGRRALLGMAPRERGLIRPLLVLSRRETALYCEARGLDWCEDASNESSRYARNRVRAGLLPKLRELHPAAERNVVRTAELLREETELLDSLVEGELAGGQEIALERLAQLPRALARLVVVRLAEGAGGGVLVPQAGGRVEEILALGGRGGGAELHVGGGVGAVLRDGMLSMMRLPPRRSRPAAGVGGAAMREAPAWGASGVASQD
ncbi:MAG: tRNA lysidine(34) synthetase TilS [Solirubrobacteraceae bacterium]